MLLHCRAQCYVFCDSLTPLLCDLLRSLGIPIARQINEPKVVANGEKVECLRPTWRLGSWMASIRKGAAQRWPLTNAMNRIAPWMSAQGHAACRRRSVGLICPHLTSQRTCVRVRGSLTSRCGIHRNDLQTTPHTDTNPNICSIRENFMERPHQAQRGSMMMQVRLLRDFGSKILGRLGCLRRRHIKGNS